MNTLYLPAWSIGPDCYKEVYDIARPYGKKVAIIGGHTALSKAMPKLKAALEGKTLLTICNLSGQPATFALPEELAGRKSRLLVANWAEAPAAVPGTLEFQPWQAAAWVLE